MRFQLFGIDNLSGQILWKKYLEKVGPFSSGSDEKMMLFTQRTTRHYPKTAQCVLVAKNKVLGTGVVFMFNPITGESIESPLNIGVKIKQAMLVHKQNDEFLRPLLVLDEKDQVHVYPKGSHQNVMDVIKQTFMYDADPQTGILSGYSLGYSTKEHLAAAVTWQAHFGSKDQQLKAAVGKNPAERVHSQGRVLSDRSVLYKYANPNLVAVVTHGSDPVHRHVLNVYLVDAVSGTVVWSVSHKRAKWPVHLVHSENWLVYSYFNDKWRRTEVGTVELYEGTAQTNSTAFSSLASPLLPLAERQAYILPFQLEAMQVTVTEKGITSKHVLMALNNGAVLEMPWAFLDPRRPAAVTPEMREEGVIPYAPELPVPYEAVINYNRSLPRVSGIHVAPSGLESTCLVLVHGLDLFYTRVAPSKTFDLLKDDFDYYLIVIVLGALLLASYLTKRLASRKALKQAWN